MTTKSHNDEEKYIDPAGAERLARAVLEQGVRDAKAGYPDALLWLDSPGFAHWCSWFDIDAGRARAAIHAAHKQRGRRQRFTYDQVEEIRRRYARGQTWEQAMAGVLGFFNENLRKEIVRHIDGLAEVEREHSQKQPRARSTARPDARLITRRKANAK